MALPLSWLNLFFPTMFLVITTIGANTPFPSLTFFIIGINRNGRPATLTCVGAAFAWSMVCSSPAMEVPQFPRKAEAETEVTAINWWSYQLYLEDKQNLGFLLWIKNLCWRFFFSIFLMKLLFNLFIDFHGVYIWDLVLIWRFLVQTRWARRHVESHIKLVGLELSFFILLIFFFIFSSWILRMFLYGS